MKCTVWDYLSEGEANAKPMRQLAAELGVSSRHLRTMVNMARKSGLPICASDRGYFLAESKAELSACSARLRAQAVDLYAAADGMENGGAG